MRVSFPSMIKFKCDFCDQRLGVPDDFIGKRVRCTKCRAVNTVPSPEEHAAKEAAAAAAAAAALPKPPAEDAASGPPKVASHSSLLDMSSGSGTFGLELPMDSAGITDSQIFATKKTIPAFDAQSKTAAKAAAAPQPATKGGTAFGVKLEDDLVRGGKAEGASKDVSKDVSKDASKDASKGKGADKDSAKKSPKIGDEDEFGLGLLEDDVTDSATSSGVDLDGLGL